MRRYGRFGGRGRDWQGEVGRLPVAGGSIDERKLRVFWTGRGYNHCNFTARTGLAPSLAERFTKAIQAMDYNDPRWKQVEAGHEPGGSDPMDAGKHCGLRRTGA